VSNLTELAVNKPFSQGKVCLNFSPHPNPKVREGHLYQVPQYAEPDLIRDCFVDAAAIVTVHLSALPLWL
jgi:hypothetical protein